MLAALKETDAVATLTRPSPPDTTAAEPQTYAHVLERLLSALRRPPDELSAFVEQFIRNQLSPRPSSMRRSTETATRPIEGLLQSARESLGELSRLQPGWDSYGAEPPSERAIFVAAGLLAAVEESLAAILTEKIQPYVIAPLNHGGVQIEWRAPKRVLEVEIGPQGHLGYLLAVGEGENRQFDEADGVARSDILRLIAGMHFG